MRGRFLAVGLLLALGGWEPFRSTDGDVTDGNDAFAHGRYDEAIRDYQAARGRVDSGGLDYDLGTAELRAADAEKDAAKKQQLHDRGLADLEKGAAGAADPKVRAQAAYNRGNALFGDGKLDDAIASYKQALRNNSDFEDARLNLELALRHRQKQEQQQQQQQQQQQNGQGQGQGQQQQQQNGQGQGSGQGSGQDQNPQNGNNPGQQGQNGQNPQNGQNGQNGQNPQNGSNQNNQQGSGSGSNQQNPQQQGQGQSPPQQNPGQGQNGQGSNGPSSSQNQQAPRPKLPNGQQGPGAGSQERTPEDGNLDQLEGESRQQRRAQAGRRADETYHPAEPEDW